MQCPIDGICRLISVHIIIKQYSIAKRMHCSIGGQPYGTYEIINVCRNAIHRISYNTETRMRTYGRKRIDFVFADVIPTTHIVSRRLRCTYDDNNVAKGAFVFSLLLARTFRYANSISQHALCRVVIQWEIQRVGGPYTARIVHYAPRRLIGERSKLRFPSMTTISSSRPDHDDFVIANAENSFYRSRKRDVRYDDIH